MSIYIAHQQLYECHKSCVFVIRDLDIKCSELDSPTDWRCQGGRRFESHGIPVCTL